MFFQDSMQSGGRGGLTSVDLLRLEMQKLEKKESAIKKMAEEYKNTGMDIKTLSFSFKKSISLKK